jgi:hypothetical protein
LKILLAGSISLVHIPNDLKGKLRNWIRNGNDFVVGDASGADSAFQRILMSERAVNVEVYFSGGVARNNLGKWPQVRVDSGLKSSGHAMHTAKDQKMVEDADCGVFLWDQRSVGTVANLLSLQDCGKDWILYVLENGTFNIETSTSKTFIESLEVHNPELVQDARKRVRSHQRRVRRNSKDQDDGRLF